MRRLWLGFVACCSLAGCNPYTRFVGETSAGPVDPVDFPQAYLGISDQTGGPNPGNMPGDGVLYPDAASVGGAPAAYYSFPYTGDPLLSVVLDGAVEAAIAYDFDDDPSAKCVPPKNYVYNQQTDDVRYDQQGNIFTLLPDAAQDPAHIQIDDGYQPVVADVEVKPEGLPCQATKEESNLVKRKDVSLALVPPANPNVPGAHPTGKPSGTFFARAIIDPSIDVHGPPGLYGTDAMGNPLDEDPSTHLGPQRWGWYQRYLLAYLDGDVVPTMSATPTIGGMMHTATVMVAQALYFPTSHPGMDAMGNPGVVSGAQGDGFDVLDAARGQSGYSPICHVFSFDPADPTNPETSVAAIQTATVEDTGTYVWCLQVVR